ncbi:MAG: hypothetical protein JO029_11925 [Candidatus Eremiobacteraeota bacterium]|nr:hypothetical protein [Candidatus Eremiobacteraeota bacterium]
MLAFALAGRGTRIHADVNALDANVTAYAALDNSQYPWVTIINKDPAKKVRARIDSISDFHSAEIMHLRAPSFDAKTETTLAGSEVSPQGQWKPSEVEKLKQTHGSVSLDLDPASAALVKLI